MSRGVKDLRATLRATGGPDEDAIFSHVAYAGGASIGADHGATHLASPTNHHAATRATNGTSPAATTPNMNAFYATGSAASSSWSSPTMTATPSYSHYQSNAPSPMGASSANGVRSGDDMRGKLNKLLALSQRDKEQIVALTAKLEAAHLQLSSGGAAANVAVQAKVGELMDQLQRSRDECEELQDSNVDLRREVAMSAAELTSLSGEVNALRASVSSSGAALQTAFERAANAERRILTLESAVGEVQKQCYVSLENHKETEQVERRRLEDKIAAMRKENADLAHELEARRTVHLSESNKARKEYDQLAQEMRDLRAKHESANQSLTSGTSAIQQAQAEALQLKQQIRTLRIDHADAVAEKEALQAEHREQMDHRAKAEARVIVELRERTEAQERKLREVNEAQEKQARERFEAHATNAREQLAAQETAARERLDAVEADFRQRLEASARTEASALAEAERARKENLVMKSAVHEMQAALTAAQTKATQLKAQLDAATHQVITLTSDLTRLTLAQRDGARQQSAVETALELEKRQVHEWRLRHEQQASQVQADQQQLQADRDQWRQQMAEGERREMEKREKLEQAHTREMEASLSQLHHTQSLLVQSEGHLSQLRTEYEALERKHQNAQKRIGQLEGEVGDSFRQLQSSKRALDGFDVLRRELALSVDKLLHFEASIEPCLSCTACTNLFDDPVSLPCGHAFCRQCCRRNPPAAGSASSSSSSSSAQTFSCAECADALPDGARSRATTATYTLDQVVPATNLAIVLGKFVFLRTVLASLKSEMAKSLTAPVAA